MPNSRNTAMPAPAATVVVPDGRPAPGLLPIAIVTLPLKPVAVLPNASRAMTSICGVMVAPAVAVLACTANASVVAAPGNTRNELSVGSATPAAVKESVYQASLLSMQIGR